MVVSEIGGAVFTSPRSGLYRGSMEDLEFHGSERFQIVRCLGAGGMGVVYEAFDREQNATVALKTLHTPSVDALLRLKREIRSLQFVLHSILVTLCELIEERGTLFFSMEFI